MELGKAWQHEMNKWYEIELRRYNKVMFASLSSKALDSMKAQGQISDCSGTVLHLENDSTTWNEYFTRLMCETLVLFKNNTKKEPSIVVNLSYAVVTIDEGALRRGEFVFLVKTPLKR